jgi:hypothetical protein
MLRIDAGDFVVHLGCHNLANLVDATLRRFEGNSTVTTS